MTMPHFTIAQRVTVPQTAIDTTIDGLRSELARCDSKASLLLALNGAVLAGTVSKAFDLQLPAAAVAAGSLGVALLMASTVLLLLAVMPSLNGGGWPSWADRSPSEVAEQIAIGQTVSEAHAIACSALRKFRRVQYAIRAVLAGLALLTLAVLLNAAL